MTGRMYHFLAIGALAGCLLLRLEIAEAAPGDFVMVAETTSNTVAKVDCTLDQVAGRADVGGTPVGLAANPWKRWVYVAVGEPSNRVVAVKADTLDVAEVSGTVGYSYAGGISLSMDGSKLLLTTLGTNGVPGGDDDTLELFRLDDAVWPPTATWVTNRLTGANPVDVQYIRSERYALVSVKDEPGILIVNADTLAITNQASSLPAWAKPEQIAMHPMTNIAYVILGGETGAVQVVDLDTLAFSNAVEVSHTPEAGPKAGCFSPNGDRFYVSCTAISNLVAFSCTNALLPEQEAGIDLNVVSSPYGMMFLAGDRAYVASTNLNTGLSVATNYLGTPVVTGTVLTVLGGAGDMVHFTRWLPAEQSVFGFHPADISTDGYTNNGCGDAIDLGGQWARMRWLTCWGDVQTNLSLLSYNFSRIDKEIKGIPTNMAIMANIAPDYDVVDLGYCISTNSWVPVDVTQYLAFVRTTVERYDGDGINDMPGLTNSVRFWQVCMEPTRGSRTNFAYIQSITYKSIKEADPACTVMLGAITGFPDRYAARFNAKFTPILSDLHGFCADVFDYHWYGTGTNEYRLLDTNGTKAVMVLDSFRSKLGTNGFPRGFPIWCSETSAYNGDPEDAALLVFPYQTERLQALDCFKRQIYPLSRDVQRVFVAWQIMDDYAMAGETNGYYDHTGLIYSGSNSQGRAMGVRKLAYYTYKKMTETLEGAYWGTLTNLYNGAGSNELFLFRVQDGTGTNLYPAWWDYFNDPAYTNGAITNLVVTGLTGTAISAMEVVPTGDRGEDITNYATAFRTTGYPVTNGTSIVVLADSPVILRYDTDSDGDMLGDTWEAVYGTNPNLPDSDNDGLGDGTEVYFYHTDPLHANDAPIVQITSPTNGQNYLNPTAGITLTATATDTDGMLKVEFYAGATKLGVASNAPYTNLWTNIASGNYTLTAVAWDTLSNVSTSAPINITVVETPVVDITAPTNGQSYLNPTSITLTATATDLDGIQKVEFYAGATKLGVASNAPYTNLWTNIASGNYTLTAVAWDTLSNVSTSAPINITVVETPVVDITAPTNGQSYLNPTSITLTATATDLDGIQKVEFYAGATKLGVASNAPYTNLWTNIASGNYTLTAVAWDTLSNVSTSAPINITVVDVPVVSITAPTNDASYRNPTGITVTATATDVDGIQKVEFYTGATKLGVASNAPYTYLWTNMARGNYALTAVASDILSNASTSAPVNITVIVIVGMPWLPLLLGQ